MAAEKSFSFEEERARTQKLWQQSDGPFVPLSLAAAISLNEAQGGDRAIATRKDFDDALDVAASALASLVPAAALRGSSVRRGDALAAIAEMRRRGLPFGFVGRHVSPRQNLILGALPGAEYQRIVSRMELVPLALGESLYEPGSPLRHVLFPVSGVVSRLHVTTEGESTEIAIIGREGLVGVAILLGGRTTADRAIVQIAGSAYRIAADALLDEFAAGGQLQPRALRYVQTLMTQMAQTAVCNRHHSLEQRLCRWLLLTLDRIESNDLAMTQELISQILGVRRAGVTEAARDLQAAGLIATRRGLITVLDRAGLEARACECYSAVKREYDRIWSGL